MYPVVWLITVGFFVWLAVVTFFLWQDRQLLDKFVKVYGQRNLRGKLDEVLQSLDELESFKRESLQHVQKVALKRYNPYHDTGGDQSFSVALLNGEGDGVVVSSLHSRAETRVFAKPVKNGAEEKFEFSEEEKLTVIEAMKKE